MVKAENRILQVAVAGSVIAHLLVFALAAVYTAYPIFAWETVEEPVEEEEEVTKMVIFLPTFEEVTPAPLPDEDGFVPVPEVPINPSEEEEKKERNYIRTTQNDGESAAPESPDFVSDRNTTGASELPPDPEGTDPIPTQDGIEGLPGIELKDRDYRDGEIKDDSARPSPESAAAPAIPPTNPNPILVNPQPPSEPAELGDPNDTTDPDARGPDTETPPENPADGTAPEGQSPTETEVPSVSLDPLDPKPSDPTEMRIDPISEPTTNPLEAEVAPEAIEASIPPPANFQELLGGDDIFPLPLRTEFPPTENAAELIEPKITPPAPPNPEIAAAPAPQIRRPELILPAEPILPVTPLTPSTPSVPLPGDPVAADPDAFQPFTRKRKLSGTISNRGPAAVDAEKTAVGIYARKVTSEIERRWHALRSRKGDYVTYGNIKIRFDVNAEGRTQNVRILSNDANPIMADFTLTAILGANAGPMPADVVSDLGLANGLLEITYDVIIY